MDGVGHVGLTKAAARITAGLHIAAPVSDFGRRADLFSCWMAALTPDGFSSRSTYTDFVLP